MIVTTPVGVRLLRINDELPVVLVLYLVVCRGIACGTRWSTLIPMYYRVACIVCDEVLVGVNGVK